MPWAICRWPSRPAGPPRPEIAPASLCTVPRLGFAVAANLRTHVLLVDEILAVGDVSFRMKCYQHMLNLKEEGVSIILVSHNMLDVSRVCDHAAVLVGGKKIFDGGYKREYCCL